MTRYALATSILLLGCTEDSPQQRSAGELAAAAAIAGPDESAREADRVNLAQLQFGYDRCADVFDPERMQDPSRAPTFVEIIRGCSGLFASRRCRAALDREAFSRQAIAAECSAAYCPWIGADPPNFCISEMPSDAEFLMAFADFTELVVQRDLRGVLDREGAEEIAQLLASFIRAQIRR